MTVASLGLPLAKATTVLSTKSEHGRPADYAVPRLGRCSSSIHTWIAPHRWRLGSITVRCLRPSSGSRRWMFTERSSPSSPRSSGDDGLRLQIFARGISGQRGAIVTRGHTDLPVKNRGQMALIGEAGL